MATWDEHYTLTNLVFRFLPEEGKINGVCLHARDELTAVWEFEKVKKETETAPDMAFSEVREWNVMATFFDCNRNGILKVRVNFPGIGKYLYSFRCTWSKVGEEDRRAALQA